MLGRSKATGGSGCRLTQAAVEEVSDGLRWRSEERMASSTGTSYLWRMAATVARESEEGGGHGAEETGKEEKWGIFPEPSPYLSGFFLAVGPYNTGKGKIGAKGQKNRAA